MIRKSQLPHRHSPLWPTAAGCRLPMGHAGKAVLRNAARGLSPGLLALWILCMLPLSGLAQEGSRPAAADGQERPSLVLAVTCETVKDNGPLNPGVVFSTSIGKVLCFTSFDPVPQRTVIYHNWFNRDVLSNKQRLTLQTPRWSCFSSIQMRESDKGPWRVEITDAAGRVLKVLRFSITD